MGDFNAGVGVTYALTTNNQFSLFATTTVKIADNFKQWLALGSGGRAQLISTLSDNWQIGLHTQVTQYYQGISHTSFDIGSTLRFSLNKNNAIILNAAETQEFGSSFLIQNHLGNIIFNVIF